MNDYSMVIVEQMDDLAVRSLPPELFDKWEDIKQHLLNRDITTTNMKVRDTVDLYGDHVNAVSGKRENVQFYFNKDDNLIFCCCI